MVGSLVVRAAAIALLGVQILLHAPLWSLALNFVASSALRGCFEPAAYALVADIARPDQRVPAFGLQRMGINLGWAVGPAAGGLLAVVMPYGAVFFFAAAGLDSPYELPEVIYRIATDRSGRAHCPVCDQISYSQAA